MPENEALINEIRHYRVDTKLIDGAPLRIRAIQSDDKDRLNDGFHRLSERSIYFRFFLAKNSLTESELTYFTEIDFDNHVALVALLLEADRGVGVGAGRYIIEPSEDQVRRAEIAITVVDEYQGRGIGALLFEHLLVIARLSKITELMATVMAENSRMLRIFNQSALPITRNLEAGIITIHIAL